MSDKWEVVGGNKPKKPPGPKPTVGNGTSSSTSQGSGSNIPGSTLSLLMMRPSGAKTGKKKKHIGPRESKIAPPPSFGEGAESDDGLDEGPFNNPMMHQGQGIRADLKKQENKPVKKTNNDNPGSGPKKSKDNNKPKDLVSALQKVDPEHLYGFFKELKNAGSIGDVYLSWIKYSADALNSQLSHVPTPDPRDWPNDLSFPKCPKPLLNAIQNIITETVKDREDEPVIDKSFVSLLAALPTLIQRGDAGWGYLLFLRQMCQIDPDVSLRRSKNIAELMESYGNRKEIGIVILWVASQAGVYSDNVLKILVDHILPYYNFKHYRGFVLQVFTCLSALIVMDSDSSLVDPNDFDKFFEASFDPKKRRDFEKFYDAVKHHMFQNLRKQGDVLFLTFLKKLGAKDFMPLSVYGKEVFEILDLCLSSDPMVIRIWCGEIRKYPKESAVLLNYLSKRSESLSYGQQLESELIQSNDFAFVAVKHPELLRIAKKVQGGIMRDQGSKGWKFPWKMSFLILVLSIAGVLYLDVSENGGGSFKKSQTGKYLESHGLLDEALYVIDHSRNFTTKTIDFTSKLFRSGYENVQPLLHTVDSKVQEYIPQVKEKAQIAADAIYNGTIIARDFLKEKVFVGALSPENIRKITKEALAFIWTNIYYAGQKVYGVIESYVKG